MRERMLVGLVLVFLVLGRPVARFVYSRTQKSQRPEMWYYLIGSVLIVILLLLISVTNVGAQTTITAYDAPIYVRNIPSDSNALAWTMCDTVQNKAYIVVDSLSWGTDETKYILVHERRHVTQGERFKGGCKEFSQKYTRDASFRLKTEAEAECAELITRPAIEQNKRFLDIVVLYKRLPGFKGDVLKEFQKACMRERRIPP